MKKLLKLFLCLLMFISFTNIAMALGKEKEGDFVSAVDVAENFASTNFMQALMIEAQRENPNANLEVSIDTDNHEIHLISDEESFLTYNYNNEYISFTGTAPETADDVDWGLYMAQEIYSQNMIYALLDTMGYTDKDIDYENELLTLDDDFFVEYGIFADEGEYSFEGDDYSESGTYIKELKFSLDRTRIDNLVRDFGIDRPDYISIATKVVKPEVTIKKKNATLVLNWEYDPVATKFEVLRSEKKDGTYKKIATVTKNTYTDKTVKYGKTYYYKVKAIGPKNKLTSDVKKFKMVPAKVKNVALGSIKTNSIKISYDKQNETGYSIERSTDNKKWTVVKTITSNSTLSFNNTGLKANKKYYYRVRAYKKVGNKKIYGSYSDVVNAKTAPDKPSLTLKANNYESLKLTITPSKGAAKYVIYRSNKKDGTYENIHETSETNYTDHGLTTNKTYFYKVKACNSNNKCSGLSSIVSLKVTLKQPKISLETGRTIPMTIVTSSIGSTEGYEIYRSTDGKSFSKIKTLESSVNRYEDLSAKKNKTYYYKVRSFVTVNGKKEYSSYSSVKSLKCLYEKPAVETIVAEHASDFNAVYAKGDTILRIFALEDDRVVVNIDAEGMGSTYEMEFVNGELRTEFFEYNITVKLKEGGVIVSGSSSEENGTYNNCAPFDIDDFITVFFSGDENINTKYNGLFENENEDVVYLFHTGDGMVMINAQLGNTGLIYDAEVNEDKLIVNYSDEERYEFEVNDNVLTIKYYVNNELTSESELTKTRDLTKMEIAKTFY